MAARYDDGMTGDFDTSLAGTTFMVSGVSRRGLGHGIVKLMSTRSGWTQRAMAGNQDFMDCMNVEYVSKESFESIEDWLRTDFMTYKILDSCVIFDDDNHPIVVGENTTSASSSAQPAK